MGFCNPRAQQRARAAQKLLKICRIAGAATPDDLVPAIKRVFAAEAHRKTAVAAWGAIDAAERVAEQKRQHERRHGVIVAIGSELRLYRRPEHAPATGRRIATPDELAAAIASATRGRVYGIAGTSAHVGPRLFAALAAPAVKAA